MDQRFWSWPAGPTKDVPIVAVEFGRLLLSTVGKPGNSLQLNFGERQSQLTFVDAGSEAALDAAACCRRAKIPRPATAPMTVDLYAKSGLLRVQRGRRAARAAVPAHRVLFGSRVESIARGRVSQVGDLRGALGVRARHRGYFGAVVAARPARSGDSQGTDRAPPLGGATAGHPQLGACGDFELVEALNEKDEKKRWTLAEAPYIDAVRGRGPQPRNGGRVRAGFRKATQPADAAALYRMLWGYSAEDLNNGADADLVEGLLHEESLDYRVLAFWNLQNITGLPSTAIIRAIWPSAQLNSAQAGRKRCGRARSCPRTTPRQAQSRRQGQPRKPSS